MDEQKNNLDFLKKDKEPISKDKLDRLSELSNELKDLRGGASDIVKNEILYFLYHMEKVSRISLETLEEVLKTFKDEEQLISQNLIPSILNDCGLQEIKLTSGERIIVEDKVKSSISDKRIADAFAEMVKLEQEQNNYDYETAFENINSLFKEKIILEKLTEEEKEKALDLLSEFNIPYDSKKEIHWQTLNSYVKEKLDSGKSLPISINIFKYQETKIK
jgi:hypothetical protein